MGLSKAAGTPATSDGMGMIARRIENTRYCNARCVFDCDCESAFKIGYVAVPKACAANTRNIISRAFMLEMTEAVRRRLPPFLMFNAGLAMAKPLAPIQATYYASPVVPKDEALWQAADSLTLGEFPNQRRRDSG
jgi:hypothetical protein